MAEEKEEKKEEAAAEGGEAKPKSKKMLFIIIGVVLLLVVGGVLFFVLGGKKAPAEGEGEAAEEHASEEKHLASFEMDHIIVNLSENASFLKVKLLIEYDVDVLEKAVAKHAHGGGGGEGGGGGHTGGEGKDKGGPPPAFEERLPIIKDSIIKVLSSKKAEEVLTAEGKDHLKEELVEAINEGLGLDEAPVTNVYFSDFIVQ